MKDINKIILGTAQFGLNYGINNKLGKPARETVFEILNLAYDSGIRFLDTAEVYGDAHKIIGDFHAHNPNRKFNIISKIPHGLIDNLINKIPGYLQELNIDELYALLFHSFDSYKSNRPVIERFRDDKQFNRGLKSIGVSIYTNEQLEEVIDDEMVDIIQLPFNLFDNYNLRGKLIEKAKEKGKEVHTRSAFLQGLFFMEDNSNAIFEALQSELRLIREIARDLTVSISALALNYCLQQNMIDKVLIGVDSKYQLEENLKVIPTEIPERYINEIKSIIVQNRNLLDPSKWS